MTPRDDEFAAEAAKMGLVLRANDEIVSFALNGDNRFYVHVGRNFIAAMTPQAFAARVVVPAKQALETYSAAVKDRPLQPPKTWSVKVGTCP